MDALLLTQVQQASLRVKLILDESEKLLAELKSRRDTMQLKTDEITERPKVIDTVSEVASENETEELDDGESSVCTSSDGAETVVYDEEEEEKIQQRSWCCFCRRN